MHKQDYFPESRGSWEQEGLSQPLAEKHVSKAQYETKWLVKRDFVCGQQTECEKAVEETSVEDGVSGSGSWNAALGCEECWYVAPTNIQSCRAADPLWNVCVCVCVCVYLWRGVEHIIRPAAARRPNKCPRTYTNRNTSQCEEKPQQTKGAVLSRPALRFQSSESGCRLAAERLEALWRQTRSPGPSPRRNNVLYSDPLTREGEQCDIKKSNAAGALMHSL